MTIVFQRPSGQPCKPQHSKNQSKIVATTSMMLALSVPLMLVGCKKTPETTQTNTEVNIASQTTIASAPMSSIPVAYPYESWQQQPTPKPMEIDKVDAIVQQLGKVQRTDPKNLDYASNIATKYSFAAETAPYLDIIDSSSYLELSWYYANPTDNDVEKKISLDYAQKANQLARAWFGDKEGSALIKDILEGKIIQNKAINGKVVELAKCEFYSCMLIIKK